MGTEAHSGMAVAEVAGAAMAGAAGLAAGLAAGMAGAETGSGALAGRI
jgi:hypothetical protein